MEKQLTLYCFLYPLFAPSHRVLDWLNSNWKVEFSVAAERGYLALPRGKGTVGRILYLGKGAD